MNDQLQSISTHESTLYSYKCLDSWIRQKHVRSETDEVWNGYMSKDNYRNGKGEIEWAFMSRKQSLG